MVDVWAMGLIPAHQPCCDPSAVSCSPGYLVGVRTIKTGCVKPPRAKVDFLCVCPFLTLLGYV